MGGITSVFKPKQPKIPQFTPPPVATPAPPPPAPTPEAPEVRDEAREQRLRSRRGAAATLLTRGQDLGATGSSLSVKRLLGQ